jgi:hypothetical protein
MNERPLFGDRSVWRSGHVWANPAVPVAVEPQFLVVDRSIIDGNAKIGSPARRIRSQRISVFARHLAGDEPHEAGVSVESGWPQVRGLRSLARDSQERQLCRLRLTE